MIPSCLKTFTEILDSKFRSILLSLTGTVPVTPTSTGGKENTFVSSSLYFISPLALPSEYRFTAFTNASQTKKKETWNILLRFPSCKYILRAVKYFFHDFLIDKTWKKPKLAIFKLKETILGNKNFCLI